AHPDRRAALPPGLPPVRRRPAAGRAAHRRGAADLHRAGRRRGPRAARRVRRPGPGRPGERQGDRPLAHRRGPAPQGPAL
ncbi:MAG: Glutaredoxin-like domain-containing protein PA3033, partial [uncultured Corynebacteriales bacterium]